MVKKIWSSPFWLLALLSYSTISYSQSIASDPNPKQLEILSENIIPMEKKMKVEIWSDVMCPFCYIGKRNFETALEQFPDRQHIEIVWKSFLLDPTMDEDRVPNESYTEYLVKRKGMNAAQVKDMLNNVTLSAKKVGLTYNFDKAIIASSLRAHKLIQYAKTKGLGNEIE